MHVKYIGEDVPQHNLVKNNIYELTEQDEGKFLINGVFVHSDTVVAAYPHPYANLIAAYAKFASENDEPWRWLQYRQNLVTGWQDCIKLSAFGPERECSPTPNPGIVRIGDWDVPLPERKPLIKGTTYYVPDLLTENLVDPLMWDNSHLDLRLLKRGLVHLTAKAANIHARALLHLE
ncbi:hypothetical protein HZS38_07705 [Xenorhabdus nematophila]|uniref:Uncharacterized protein n=1 Tax=Xenorhabdus nematophila (strain ATCC 19061 / DSM 3370 / CCUG 14189 / LMG 1036 / NCIMB 9965 / AN6) TaxID=406817 RepID=D3VEJ9_XENNA|nr:hypothetical protein [Xenorhabdus nematophila]CEE91625.1 hypothetical protein XNA1_2260001 [Xenorhabdus nematophila str. Anatoliense]CEF31447.1 hypothetical protein XNW1_3690001 [Xenorhabdus nematophila str. Websteri]AYA40371.1 hypothetical protein D3790_07820 [Xenorhabdus nematophila]KHD27414.1 hypothetical protein LH67_18330 [Xenorhabdus nematophila]MBA0019044.1 hypothetical protein [Xenorhabdus nematophila]